MKEIFDLAITTIKIGDENYPKELTDLVDPPEEISIRGTYSPDIFKNCLAVVGSRKMSQYGLSTTRSFVSGLVKKNIVIVSGFMYGVDSTAHKAALVTGGRTIAILANGLNHIYPAENEKLYMEIIQKGGCLISEYPEDFKPQAWTFPKRNRIVAALSLLGTLVVEASEQSGSLITASYADALNRPLFAVPGPVNSPTSEGTNRLIKDKIAQMVTTPMDIISFKEK